MSTREIAFAPREHYHVFNRGNSKQKIFVSYSDYERLQFLLFIANSKKSFNTRDILDSGVDLFSIERGDPLVTVESYCLMPNHFHLILSTITENGISDFMLKVMTGYSMYFNRKYERTGKLFEGTFKARHADTDEYLKYLFSYIHLNPLSLTHPDWKVDGVKNKINALRILTKYPYSSLQDFLPPRGCLGGRKESNILDMEMYINYFDSNKDTECELFDWLSYRDELIQELKF